MTIILFLLGGALFTALVIGAGRAMRQSAAASVISDSILLSAGVSRNRTTGPAGRLEGRAVRL